MTSCARRRRTSRTPAATIARPRLLRDRGGGGSDGGSEIDIDGIVDGRSPIETAVSFAATAVVSLLLERGARVSTAALETACDRLSALGADSTRARPRRDARIEYETDDRHLPAACR